MILSINPNYNCNLRCRFCYLSTGQLKDSKRLHIDDLMLRLSEVSQHRQIEHVDIYGGEISILGDEYLQSLFSAVKMFYKKPINVITNFTKVNSLFFTENHSLTVSWDYKARAKWDNVYQNMLNLKRPFHMLMLVSPQMDPYFESIPEIVEMLKNLKFLESFELKPYSNSMFNSGQLGFKQFERWVKEFLKYADDVHFDFINRSKIQDSLLKAYSSWSDSHLYITPNGRFAVLDFDEQKREYFKELDSFADYLKWTEIEKNLIGKSPVCQKCEFFGNCLSEHLQFVQTETQGCNGFKDLLQWAHSQDLGSHQTHR